MPDLGGVCTSAHVSNIAKRKERNYRVELRLTCFFKKDSDNTHAVE